MDYTGLYEDVLAMEQQARDEMVKAESARQWGRAAALSAFACDCLDFRREILSLTRTLVARIYV